MSQSGPASTSSGGGGGGVTGPGSSTDNALARWDGVGGSALQNSTVIVTDNGEMTNASQPAFLTTKTNTSGNVTGAGTAYNPVWNTTIFDQNSDWDGSTTFTAPVTGRYFFVAQIRMVTVSAAMTSGFYSWLTSNRNYQNTAINPGAITETTSGSTSFTTTMVVFADMDASDTCSIRITISSGAGDTADFGQAGNATSFGGFLVC